MGILILRVRAGVWPIPLVYGTGSLPESECKGPNGKTRVTKLNRSHKPWKNENGGRD